MIGIVVLALELFVFWIFFGYGFGAKNIKISILWGGKKKENNVCFSVRYNGSI